MRPKRGHLTNLRVEAAAELTSRMAELFQPFRYGRWKGAIPSRIMGLVGAALALMYGASDSPLSLVP